jgi:hypothetical protein
MSFDIVGAAVHFVTLTTNQIVSAFTSQTLIKENQINLPATVQKVRQDQRVIQAEMDYYQRREARKKEFMEIQDTLVNTDTEVILLPDRGENYLKQSGKKSKIGAN